MRSQIIRLRVSETEKTEIQENARAAGMSLSDFLRHAGQKAKIPDKARSNAMRDLVRQVSRIGSNMNQVARWVNTYKSSADTVQVVAWLSALMREIKKCI